MLLQKEAVTAFLLRDANGLFYRLRVGEDSETDSQVKAGKISVERRFYARYIAEAEEKLRAYARENGLVVFGLRPGRKEKKGESRWNWACG